MKHCNKCKEDKSVAEFHKDHRNKKDGLQGWCKDCVRLYGQSEAGKRSDRKYSRSEKGREADRKHYYNSPEKAKALNALNHAIRDGKINRPDFCESCFQEKFVEGHHPDYDKPLEVTWLCKKCHTELHKDLILV